MRELKAQFVAKARVTPSLLSYMLGVYYYQKKEKITSTHTAVGSEIKANVNQTVSGPITEVFGSPLTCGRFDTLRRLIQKGHFILTPSGKSE